MVRLSIIIPVYNEEKFLKRCLDSVCGLPDDVQVIVINDGSTDGSQKIMEEYKGQGFSFGNFKKSRGVSVTRNDGIDESEGEWITFLDSDDEYSKTAVSSIIRACEEADAQGIKMVMFNHLRAYGEERPVPRFNNPSGVYTLNSMPSKWQAVWSKALKRDAVMLGGIRFREGLQFGEDELFNIECMRAFGKLYHSDAATVIKHFDNPQSLTKVRGASDVCGLTNALMELICQEDKSDFSAFLRNEIAEHWKSKTFIKIFG